mgnify:FL=1
MDILFPRKPSRLYLLIRNGGLILICALFLASGLRSFLNHRLKPLQPQAVSPPSQVGTQDRRPQSFPDRVQVRAIVDRNIFGGSTEPTQEEEDTVSLDEIPLAENLKNLKLLGTIVHSDQPGWAIIENKKKRQQELLREGDQIDEIKIKKILRNNVVVQIGEEDRVLSIDYKTRQRMKERTRTGSASGRTTAGEGSVISLDRDYVVSSLANVNDVMRSARILPYLENGDPIGFRLNAIRNNSFFDKLQLKNGDIILGADGEPVTSPQRLLQMAEQLKEQNQVTLDIRRGNQDLALEYTLQ